MQTTQILIFLDATIANNKLVITVEDDTGPVPLDPNSPLEPLLMNAGDADSLVLEVRDFVYEAALYRVHAATLEADGRTVRAHWRATDAGNGVSCIVTDPAGAGRDTRFIIGAVPVGSGAPESFAPGRRSGGGAPGDPDPGDPTDPNVQLSGEMPGDPEPGDPEDPNLK